MKTLNDFFQSDQVPVIQAYGKDIAIDNILIHQEKKAMQIFLKSENLVPESALDEIHELFTGIFTEFLDLSVRFTSSFSEIGKILAFEKSSLEGLLVEAAPSCKAEIEKIQWTYQDGLIRIHLASGHLMELLLQRRITEVFGNFIKQKYDIELTFRLTAPDIQEPAEDFEAIKRQKEDMMRQEIQNNLAQVKKKEKAKPKPGAKSKSDLIIGRRMGNEVSPIKGMYNLGDTVVFEGRIFSYDTREINQKVIHKFYMTDSTNSITVKFFIKANDSARVKDAIKEGASYRVMGQFTYDTYDRENLVMAKAIQEVETVKRMDHAKKKRIEFHAHTTMSDMDGMATAKSLVKTAAAWEHPAIAITDHGVVQAFPDAMNTARGADIDILYGVEGYLVDDESLPVTETCQEDFQGSYVIFDLETTGFSPYEDDIIEIGAVKIQGQRVVDSFNQLVRVDRMLDPKITELTGIRDDMLADQPDIEDVFPRFKAFVEGSVLVAHNAKFDCGFLRTLYSRHDLVFDYEIADTLGMMRSLFHDWKAFRLDKVCKKLGISLGNHHRAVDDARATGEIFLRGLEELEKRDVHSWDQARTYFKSHVNWKAERPFHVIVFAKNQDGVKDLYKLISTTHIDTFYRKPRLMKSYLRAHRDNLLIGSACEAGEVYISILQNRSEEDREAICSFYDYLEIQPLCNNAHLIRNGNVKSKEGLIAINREIIQWGKRLGKEVIATGDVHFLNKEDEVYRRILMSGKGFDDADDQPPLYLRTTEEMLGEFAYLSPEEAREVVIEGPHRLYDQFEPVLPIPDGTFPPHIEGSDEELRSMCEDKAKSIYGDPLPELVATRLEKELKSIIGNGYSVLYISAQKLVKKSNDLGYLVGSRGSVGSSFAATMSGITEVNPLPPHYVCPQCQYSEFILDGSYGSGADMPEKDCPHCGTHMEKNGFDIPFEVFLGFEGDKEPDIDLNFGSPVQGIAHKYTGELFGEQNVFKAGTIGTIASKTAYGFVKKYYEAKDQPLSRAEAERLIQGCTGIKRTSGQHPGGIMVVPRNKDIYDFSPIQYPANDVDSGVLTTHFDYHSISGRILKLDILGHDTPLIIRMLEDFTGTDASTIPLDEPKTMSLFTSTEAMGISAQDIDSPVGSFGIPEFGTKFVRQMLIDTQPTTFSELARISGLSHGTDVWLNNAQELVRKGTTSLKHVISTRDDIMIYLIQHGLEKKRAFTIMEKVRKGKGLAPEDEAYMKEMEIPDWYIWSCKQIKYMFPKAHAVAYVMMSYRIAYYKVYYPEAFYATYFTIKLADFDLETVIKGREFVASRRRELEEMGNDKSAKEKNLLTVLEVASEMCARNIRVIKPDLYRSDDSKFMIVDGQILPPLRSLPGMGENAAKGIVAARKNGDFLSIEDLVQRAKVNKTSIEGLRSVGCLDGLPESNQLSLFSI
jgi:DNA polymerase-3 subunit alpha (Gram-positive type)